MDIREVEGGRGKQGGREKTGSVARGDRGDGVIGEIRSDRDDGASKDGRGLQSWRRGRM